MRRAQFAAVLISLLACSCGDILYNAKIGNIERIQKGLDAGAPINKTDRDGNTPLMIAVNENQYAVIDYLCKKGANLNVRNSKGYTALMNSVIEKKYEMTDYLCQRGANLDVRNNSGATALILATYYNHFDAAKILIKYNPDKSIRDNHGNTALDYAEQYEYTRIIALLTARERSKPPGEIKP